MTLGCCAVDSHFIKHLDFCSHFHLLVSLRKAPRRSEASDSVYQKGLGGVEGDFKEHTSLFNCQSQHPTTQPYCYDKSATVSNTTTLRAQHRSSLKLLALTRAKCEGNWILLIMKIKLREFIQLYFRLLTIMPLEKKR